MVQTGDAASGSLVITNIINWQNLDIMIMMRAVKKKRIKDYSFARTIHLVFSNMYITSPLTGL